MIKNENRLYIAKSELPHDRVVHPKRHRIDNPEGTYTDTLGWKYVFLRLTIEETKQLDLPERASKAAVLFYLLDYSEELQPQPAEVPEELPQHIPVAA